MMRTETPTTRAFWQLADLARLDGFSDARLFALVWLAAGRMVVLGKAPTITSVDQLVDVAGWKGLHEAGFPPEGLDLVERPRAASSTAHETGRRAAAAGIVAELQRELGDHPWDVLPCVVASGPRRGFELEGSIVPELAALLLDLVGEPRGAELWVPFDYSGQLTVEALRRGWRVLAASPLHTWSLVSQLLLTIEAGAPQHHSVRYDVERDSTGRPIATADYSLVVPPFAIQVRESRMATWDATGGRSLDQFARSESWAIFEFVNRTKKRAVFVAPQGVLFAKGQEQRLREYLLHRGGECNEVEAVIALPPGVFSATAIAGAALVIVPGGSADAVRMVDLGSGRRSLSDAGEIIEANRAIAIGAEQATQTDRLRHVSRDEIAANEYSFAPSRYLRRVADLGTDVVRLGDICEPLRPPTTAKEQSPYEVAEVGMQDLNAWHAIHRSPEKSVYLKNAPKDSALVQPGDIVFSIKGTVGKLALMGEAAQKRPTVVSQSCLALRLIQQSAAKNISPEYLLMYLRSPHGQAQLEGLQVGAGVQHISPSTLMTSVLIPVPSAEVYREVREEFDKLCRLEEQVAELEGEMAQLIRGRWSTDGQ
jgi:hypothetical protein